MRDPLDPEQHEPDPFDEFDTGSDEASPPQPEDPRPSVPEVSSPAANLPDAGAELKATFWKLVLLYKLSLLGLSLGAMLVFFGVDYRRGGALLAGALVLSGYTLYRTRKTKEQLDADEIETEADDEAPADGNPEDNDGGTEET